MTDDELAKEMVEVFCKDCGTLCSGMLDVLRFVREHDAKHRPAETEKPRRVPVQISGYGEGLTTGAVANDGTVWVYEFGVGWHRLPDLPQD